MNEFFKIQVGKLAIKQQTCFDFTMATGQGDLEWSKYIPWVTTAVLGVYVIYQFVKKDKSCEWVNKSIQKDQPKVATPVDIEDLGEKTVFCRCWRTKNVCI